MSCTFGSTQSLENRRAEASRSAANLATVDALTAAFIAGRAFGKIGNKIIDENEFLSTN